MLRACFLPVLAAAAAAALAAAAAGRGVLLQRAARA